MKKSSSRLKIVTALLAGTLAWAAAVQANVVTVAGALTTTDPTFNRPTTTTSLSAVGTNVYYDIYAFTVSAATAFTLETTAAALTPGTADDTFVALYGGSFSRTSPLTGLLAVDDDSGVGDLSLLTYSTLNPGTTYYAVITTFNNATTGTYTANLTATTGTLTLSAVPEPSTYALLGLGAMGVAVLASRRRQAAA